MCVNLHEEFDGFLDLDRVCVTEPGEESPGSGWKISYNLNLTLSNHEVFTVLE